MPYEITQLKMRAATTLRAVAALNSAALAGSVVTASAAAER